MNTERLIVLRDFLKTVPPEEFNINLWDCDTTACAMGWACRIPEFKIAGLYADSGKIPRFQDAEGYTAASIFFGLKRDDATWLFGPFCYRSSPKPTTDDVIARINELLERTR